MIDIHRIFAKISPFFRKRRMYRFLREFEVGCQTTILDVGGTPFNWRLIDSEPQVILLNVARVREPLKVGMKQVVGDGRSLPFSNKAIDVVFSNSTIEHLYDWESQKSFAQEVRRVGKGYYVQTPNRWFPIEPHYLTPFIHFVPRGLRRYLLRNFTVWGLLTRPSDHTCADMLRQIRLLNFGEMQALFPEARIERERFCGLTKSLIAIYREASKGEAAPSREALT